MATNKKNIKAQRCPANPDSPEKAYSRRISLQKIIDLGKGIHNHVVIARRYRDMKYSAGQLAADLDTNTRYISAAINYRYGCNYSVLVNRMRIEDAKQMLENPECTLNMDEIAYSVGFANKQSFYTAFAKSTSLKPRQYREQYLNRLSQSNEDFNPEAIDFSNDPFVEDDI